MEAKECPPLSPSLLCGRTGDQSITFKSVFTMGLTVKRSPRTHGERSLGSEIIPAHQFSFLFLSFILVGFYGY